MAHHVIGIDLGSDTIKLARFEGGFRRATLRGCYSLSGEEARSLSGEERVTQQLKIVRRFLSDKKMMADDLAVALPGSLLTFRLVDLPFSDPKRIESVLGYELESQMISGIEEFILDHVIVGTRGTDTRVLAVAARRSLIQAIVNAATAEQLSLRLLGAAPLAYAAFLGEAAKTPVGSTLIVDVGREATNLCVLQNGMIEMVRTIGRGGEQLTEAIAQGFRLDVDTAEKAKRDLGFIGHAGMVAQTEPQAHMDACLREATRPFVRELRQTMAAYQASFGGMIERIWLAGGGARLVGLAEHFAEELRIGVEPLPPGAAAADQEEVLCLDTEMPVAVGMGFISLGGASRINFRKGEFAYKSDYSFLRARARHLGALAALVCFFATINALAGLRSLRGEHERLAAKLKQETIEVFGVARNDARAISEELKGSGSGAAPPIPTVTAFDVFDEIARHVPPADKIKLDILELDIKPKKTYIKATAESAKAVDDLAEGLSKIECFEEVQKGKLSSVSAPATAGSDGKAASEFKQFTFTINTTCP